MQGTLHKIICDIFPISHTKLLYPGRVVAAVTSLSNYPTSATVFESMDILLIRKQIFRDILGQFSILSMNI